VTASFAIRAAELRDLPALNALMHASRAYQGEYYRIIENYFVAPEQLAANKIFLAERAGVILGFYSLVVEGEPELDLMFVADAAQGTGAGRVLFDHMKQTAHACGCASVLIGSHPPSVDFYERMGAVRCGTRPPQGRVTWDRPLLKLQIVENAHALDT
jgi:GNAT superfamily N-acetyltransferase